MLCAGATIGASFGLSESLTVIPYPQQVTLQDDVFVLPTNRIEKTDVIWKRDAGIPSEGYRLTVTPTEITAWSSDDAGAFYALQTLKQMAKKVEVEGRRWKVEIPCCEIEDAPRYPHRGYMLDDVRHFMGKEVVKKYLDLMSEVKMNVFHWHLTDDEGWRLELKCHPEVCARGCVKPTSMEHGATEECQAYTGEPYGPFFYTHEDVREILAYAAERHITVIPEFDFPAHSRALFVSHPEFTCIGPNETFAKPWCVMGPQYECFCAANEDGMRFIEDILDEICDLFPSKYIHIGGDECPPNRWRECPKCRKLMSDLGLPPERASMLQTRITIRFAEFLARRGRTAVAWRNALQWDAGVPAVLPENLVLQLAHDVVDARMRTARGIEIIQSPKDATYFDMPQDIPSDPYQYYAGPAHAATLRSVFENDPEYGMTREQAAHVRGVECCSWAEFTWGWFDLNWKMWPRSFAVAEVAWTGYGKTAFGDFLSRVKPLRERLVARHVHAAPVVDHPAGRLVAAAGCGTLAKDSLAGTQAAILAEGYGPTDVPATEMREYVKAGGTLVVSADQVRDGKVPPDLAGVSFDGSTTNCFEVVMDENGYRAFRIFPSHGVHRLWLGAPASATVFMRDGRGNPAVWANAVGKGRVYTVGCRAMRAESTAKDCFLEERRKEIEKGLCPYPFVRYLRERILEDGR